MTTQAGLALELYKKNKKIDHAEFVAEFLKVFPSQTPKIAALYWQNKARRAKFGLEPIKLPAEYSGKEEKAEKPKKAKVKQAKTITVDHSASNRLIAKAIAEGRIPEAAPKTETDIAKIKAANLARMKEITAKNKIVRSKYNGNIARDADKPFDSEDFTPEAARAELESDRDLDSFAAPRFLSKDMVKALV